MSETRNPNHPGELGSDRRLAERDRTSEELEARARAIDVLHAARVPFLVGGAYAFCCHTGIYRDTKDLDLFQRREDAERALKVLAADGWRPERTDEVWLYKAYKGDYFVDLIFSSGNGIAVVDDEWFAHANDGEAFGRRIRITPAEEMIWSKAFVLERERYDGADVLHLIHACGEEMDWDRILRRFERYWEVLLSHLMLFRFAYPSERCRVPEWVMHELMTRTLHSVREGEWPLRVCRGPLLSRVNYGFDVTHWGYLNGREWDELDREGGDALGTGSELQDSSGSNW